EHGVVGGTAEDEVVERITVARIGDGDICGWHARSQPAGAGARDAIAPDLTVEADAEDLVIAGEEALYVAAGERRTRLRPLPERVLVAVEVAEQEHDVVGGVGVADTADGEIETVAVRGGVAERRVDAGGLGPVAPDLAVRTKAEDLAVGTGDTYQVAARVCPRSLRPVPDSTVGASEEDDVVGGVGVPGIGDGDVDAVAAGGKPGVIAAAIAPELAGRIEPEGLAVAADDLGQRRERIDRLRDRRIARQERDVAGVVGADGMAADAEVGGRESRLPRGAEGN